MRREFVCSKVPRSWTTRSLPTGVGEEKSSALLSAGPASFDSREPVEGLRMAQNFHHTPVLAREIVELFTDLPVGGVVDATLGAGEHARRILEANPSVRLVGIDRDELARNAASATLEPFASRARVVAGTFGDLADIVVANRDFLGDGVGGVLFDLGVSSPQLDDPQRGFSFRYDAPLDMRMDTSQGQTAASLLTKIDQHELARLLRTHGEARFAGAIAKSIKEAAPTTTGELVVAVERAVPPAARRRGHVATRVFQALRVSVNDEENQLTQGLGAAIMCLQPGGVVAVISYHSGEDREVKRVLREASTGGCTCPPGLDCVCGAVPVVTLKKASAILATADEVVANPRARSARLRIAWKVAP